VAYVCSILIHAAALALLAVLVLRAVENAGAPESVVADTAGYRDERHPGARNAGAVATPAPVRAAAASPAPAGVRGRFSR